MYSAIVYAVHVEHGHTADVEQLIEQSETLPQLVTWCAKYFTDFDSVQVVRREFNRVGLFSRAYTLKASAKPGFVLITLVKP